MPKRARSAAEILVRFIAPPCEQCVISGGMLPTKSAWLPDLESGQDDDKFLTLRLGDRRLAGFMGLSDSQISAVVKAIQNARGEHCDAVVDEKLLQAESGPLPPSIAVKKKIRAAFVKNHPEQVPDKVEVFLHDVRLVTQFTVDKRKSVAVLATADNLDNLFELRDKPCADAVGDDTPVKHIRDMTEFGHPEIKYNASRDVPCVYYTDADGRCRYHSESVSAESDSPDGDDDKTRWQAACDRLHEFFLANHVPHTT